MFGEESEDLWVERRELGAVEAMVGGCCREGEVE